MDRPRGCPLDKSRRPTGRDHQKRYRLVYRRHLDCCQYLEQTAQTYASLRECTITYRLRRPLNATLQVTVILFTVLYPISLFSSFVYYKFFKDQGPGPIALPPDEEDRVNGIRGPREVDAEGWGS